MKACLYSLAIYIYIAGDESGLKSGGYDKIVCHQSKTQFTLKKTLFVPTI